MIIILSSSRLLKSSLVLSARIGSEILYKLLVSFILSYNFTFNDLLADKNSRTCLHIILYGFNGRIRLKCPLNLKFG